MSSVSELQTLLTSNKDDKDPVVNVLTSALNDPEPTWSLQDILNVVQSNQDIELNALDLIPLLWNQTKTEALVINLLKEITTRSSGKECIIALQEAQEDLLRKLSLASEDEPEETEKDELIKRLCILLSLYKNVVPRLVVRKKGPAEILAPILKGLSTVLVSARALTNKSRSLYVIETIASLVSVIAQWVESMTAVSAVEKIGCLNLASTILLSGVAIYGTELHARLADKFVEDNFPRRHLRSSLTPKSQAGRELGSKLVESAIILNLTPKSLMGMASKEGALSLASLILLAHWPIDQFVPELQQLTELANPIQICLQNQIIIDECTLLILSRANREGILQQNGLLHGMITISSVNPDPDQRNSCFVALTLLLKRLPARARLDCLAQLSSPEEPAPQMRVAAIGLIKDFVLDALSSDKSDVFASKSLFTACGRNVLRPNPMDLFERTVDPKEFLEDSESARLIECLGFYYTVLQRDVHNKTGIRDPSILKETKQNLLDPLAAKVQDMEGKLPDDAHSAQMTLVALKIGLNRIEECLNVVNSTT